MRLIYVFLGGSLKESSVQNKILCQVQELNNNKIEAEAWLFSTEVNSSIRLNQFAKLLPLAEYERTHKYFHSYFQTQYYYTQILKFLQNASNEFDIIFLRHGKSGPAYFNLLKAFASKILLYIPSNSLKEQLRERQAAKKTTIGGFIFRWIEYYFYFYRHETKLLEEYLSLLKGIVVFTPEFGEILKKYSKKRINIIYNRDGVNCENVKPREVKKNFDDEIKLLFMKGSSMNQPWSGLERLIDSIKREKDIKIKLYITGDVSEAKIYKNDFVELTGKLSKTELEVLVNKVDLGVSNLANYMIDFSETTNLKSREYYARGLPFIQANTMPDIEGTSASNYYLLLPNDNSRIDLKKVVNFAQKIRRDNNAIINMRKFAEMELDWSVTVKELSLRIKEIFSEDLKICYIFMSAGLKSDSIQNKIRAQINALNYNGVKCRGAFFTNDVDIETVFDSYIKLLPYEKSDRKYLNAIKQKRLLIKNVSKYIESSISENEYIYLRYPGVSSELYRFAKSNCGRIISEHQSKEIDEIRSTKNEHPFGFKLSKLISFFLYQLWPIYNEKIWSGPYSGKLKAKVAVTNEIALYNKGQCNNVWVIPNGIETANFIVRKVASFNGVLKILFLKGASSLAPWNGLDRLINSIDRYASSNISVQLIICGKIINGEIPNRNYIVQMGYQNPQELDTVFSNVNIGFSTLCLYKKNLKEAAVLKAREYFARGLPFVYAYTDPDLEGESQVADYTMQVPNDDSLIDFDKVVEFAKRVSEDPSHPEKMRKFAEEKLDWKIKMGQLKQLLSN